MRKRLFGTAALVTVAALGAGDAAGKKGEPGIILTIYNPSAVSQPVNPYQPNYGGYRQQVQPYYGAQPAVDPSGYAVVTERRKIQVPNGGGEVRFTDVPAQIDPTTVQFVDETDPGAQVTQQRFEHDLASVDTLLARYVGQPITVVTDQGERTGTLLWYDASQFLLKTDDAKTPMQIIERGKNLRDVRFGNPTGGGISSQPTLIWQLASKKAGEHLAQVTYQTRGIAWSADYNVVLSSDEKKVDVSGWLSVTNQSGAAFADATLRLIAGDVARDSGVQVQPQYGQYDQYGNPVYNTAPPKAPPIFEYDLPDAATIDNGATKQVEIFGTTEPAVSRTVVYEYVPRQVAYMQQQRAYGGAGYPLLDPNADGYGPKTTGQLDTYLELAMGKGKALPPGRVRIYKRNDTDGTLNLVSEDKVDAAGKDASLRVKTGTTTDLTAERRQADWQLDEAAREAREKMEIKLKNNRKDAVEVLVVEHQYRWSNWSIENESSPATIGANDTALFRVKVPAGGSTTLTYTTLYTW